MLYRFSMATHPLLRPYPCKRRGAAKLRRRHVAASFAAGRARQETLYLGGRSWVRHFMQIAINDDGPAATVTMIGRLDASGANDVAIPLATLSGSKSSLFVDMAGVTFLASLGLRHLLTAAKAMAAAKVFTPDEARDRPRSTSRGLLSRCAGCLLVYTIKTNKRKPRNSHATIVRRRLVTKSPLRRALIAAIAAAAVRTIVAHNIATSSYSLLAHPRAVGFQDEYDC